MDLVTDFNKLINQNTEKTINSLAQIYIDTDKTKNSKFYKDITKYYSLMYVWVSKLSETETSQEKKILLYNVLLNYCSIINCVKLGDKKLIMFLYRNTIEGIIRYITSELTTKELDSLFSSIIKDEDIEIQKELVQMYTSQIKQIYNDACLYIHTDTSKITKDIKNLIDYIYNMSNESLEMLRKDFEKMNIAIISIFKLRYVDVYLGMKANSRALHDEIMPLNDNIRYGDFIRQYIKK